MHREHRGRRPVALRQAPEIDEIAARIRIEIEIDVGGAQHRVVSLGQRADDIIEERFGSADFVDGAAEHRR